MSDQPTPLRLGFHGSPDVALHIVRIAGWDPAAVSLGQYDIADPFTELRRGEFDVMIVKFGLKEPDLACSRALTYDARGAVVAADSPLAKQDAISVEELADQELFDRPGEMPQYVWDEVVPPHTPAGRPLHRRHRVTDIPAMMRLVAEGNAVHLSLISLADVAPPTVRVVPVTGLPPAPVSLAWCNDRELPQHVRRFVAAAEAGAER
ncbi:LysR substrate-binding domain-containing protein [Streptomyces aurantiogriseus]|uniref:LysR substrate-binding domain-containing protein n=1 Tax=Streptomyces aurantiogriseus TaxID=66870 RepID=A0A918C1U2_9ACTN|nr:LysR substrate-binding domain-containing protein [Streptomyces aurantiogriseus]GGR02592.1 hypothetical protein GCM10010251_17990 [Streptomyces aurantiogriseus]